MKTIVLASNNPHKVKEFKEILKEYTVLSLEDIGYKEEIKETGKTFLENAKIKAKTIHDYVKKLGKEYIVLADDSGLCVHSLKDAPGVWSARYAGNHDSQKNRDKIRKEVLGKDPSASFVCTIVLYYPTGEYKSFTGKTEGKIIQEELGNKDFGYDCIFYSNDLGKTFGQAKEEEKNKVSHRARAIKEMLKEL